MLLRVWKSVKSGLTAVICMVGHERITSCRMVEPSVLA
jgi:hypothetical protein